MNYLGIDYGKKFVGIALSQGTFAEPLKTVSTNEAMLQIKELCANLHIDTCIVGQPEGFLRKDVQLFVENLKEVISQKIILWDETLSSFESKTRLRGKNKDKKNKEHKGAAALILQSYLETRGSNFNGQG